MPMAVRQLHASIFPCRDLRGLVIALIDGLPNLYSPHAVEGTGTGTRQKLNRVINAGLTNNNIKARLASLQETSQTSSPAEFGKLIACQPKMGQGNSRG
jgi:hypothetical protein